MTNYKLYYFNVTGLAEPIRFLLHYCGVDFEDIRFSDFDEWKLKYKKEMPMEQVPVLEFNGNRYHQHVPICRYIAKKFNLCGSTEEEALEIDALIQDINDLRIDISTYYREENADLKAKLKEKLDTKLSFTLDKLESRIAKNKGFFFNGKITWADIYYTGISEVMTNILKVNLHEKHPNLKKLTDTVRNNERIKKYIEKRPVTTL